MDEQNVKRVWVGLLEADHLARYYAKLAERFGRYHRLGMSVVITLTLGSVTLTFASLPSGAFWIPGIFALPAAILAIYLSYEDYSRKAGMASTIASQCMELTLEWRQLWYELSSNNVMTRASELDRRLNQISSPAIHITGFNDDSLSDECEKETHEYWPSVLSSTN